MSIIVCLLLICADFLIPGVSAQSDNPEMDKEVDAAIKAFVEKNRSPIIDKAIAAINP